MAEPNVDTVVIGGGAMGSSAAWHLARRGRDVLLLERFPDGHVMGASHGASRNFNVAYADPTYVAMLVEALPLWRELEAEAGVPLLDQVGVVNHGPIAHYDAVHDALLASGIPAEFIPLDEAQARWPGIRFDTRVLFNASGGRLNADATVAALQSAAAARGAHVVHEAHAQRVQVLDDDRVRVTYVTTEGPTAVLARRVVVTVGAWTYKLIGGDIELPSLVVTQEQPAHFGVTDATFTWPGFNHAPGPNAARYWRSPIYGLMTPGEGVKVGWHGVGPVVDPDARTFEPEPDLTRDLRQYVRDWLPGADPDVFASVSCTYTTPPDGNFVLGAVGPVTVGAGFAGHGFKFVPTIGRMLADLTDGKPAPAMFGLGARTPSLHTGFGAH